MVISVCLTRSDKNLFGCFLKRSLIAIIIPCNFGVKKEKEKKIYLIINTKENYGHQNDIVELKR